MTFRYARHTTNLKRLENFYIKIIGLEILGSFKNHSDYNGLFLGLPDENWHLEFTTSKDLPHQIFDEDDALVFYFENQKEIKHRTEIAKTMGLEPKMPKNPYWQQNGVMFLDPDNYPIILTLKK